MHYSRLEEIHITSTKFSYLAISGQDYIGSNSREIFAEDRFCGLAFLNRHDANGLYGGQIYMGATLEMFRYSITSTVLGKTL